MIRTHKMPVVSINPVVDSEEKRGREHEYAIRV